MTEENGRAPESGNAFFYILIAVVLLAALAYAVSQGSRSSVQSLSGDRISLLATGILEYADAAKTAVAQLRLRGVPLSAISFAHPDLDPAYGVYGGADAASEIFNPAGGGIHYQPPREEALAATGPYVFTAGNEVQSVGTTCGGNSCADLLMISPPLTRDVCVALNERLGVSNPGGNPPIDTAIEIAALFDGTATYSQTIGNEAASDALRYESAACLQEDTSDNYYFYQVLLPR